MVKWKRSAYLTKNNVLTRFQSGFRRVLSTATSLLNVSNTWLVNIDHSLINGVMFVDIQKSLTP